MARASEFGCILRFWCDYGEGRNNETMAVGGRALVDGTRDVAPVSGVDFLLQIEINSMLKIEQHV